MAKIDKTQLRQKITPLNDNEISLFCESISISLSAGLLLSDAIKILMKEQESISRKDSNFYLICNKIYRSLINNKTFAQAIIDSKGFSDNNFIKSIDNAEKRGKLDEILASFASSYSERASLIKKIRSSIIYPTVLMIISLIILGFTIFAIIPIFTEVYQSIAGSITAGSFGFVSVSIIIGYICFILTAILTITFIYLVIVVYRNNDINSIISLLSKIPLKQTRFLSYQISLSNFLSNASLYFVSGQDIIGYIKDIVSTQNDKGSAGIHYDRLLLKKLSSLYDYMTSDGNESSPPLDFPSAAMKVNLFPDNMIDNQLLLLSYKAGNMEDVLNELSEKTFDQSLEGIDSIVNKMEPLFAIFLTVSISATLLAIILPLIGVMFSIG